MGKPLKEPILLAEDRPRIYAAESNKERLVEQVNQLIQEVVAINADFTVSTAELPKFLNQPEQAIMAELEALIKEEDLAVVAGFKATKEQMLKSVKLPSLEPLKHAAGQVLRNVVPYSVIDIENNVATLNEIRYQTHLDVMRFYIQTEEQKAYFDDLVTFMEVKTRLNEAHLKLARTSFSEATQGNFFYVDNSGSITGFNKTQGVNFENGRKGYLLSFLEKLA